MARNVINVTVTNNTRVKPTDRIHADPVGWQHMRTVCLICIMKPYACNTFWLTEMKGMCQVLTLFSLSGVSETPDAFKSS